MKSTTSASGKSEVTGVEAPPSLALVVQYAIDATGLPRRAELRKWLRAALRRDAEVTLRIVSEDEGRALNREYRKRDYATNVLTFVYQEELDGLVGDIVLCAPVVEREATEQRKPLTAHFAHLVIHGALHLQGYDHEDDSDAQAMEASEVQILARLGYDNPYL
jgi:probable rRNA maturation factor